MYNYATLGESELEYVDIGPSSELPPGERLFVDIGGKPVVIFNIAGQLFSIADVCSHDDGPVGEGSLDGYRITCPRHGAQFDIRTGKVLQMPAVVDIPAYPVKVVEASGVNDSHVDLPGSDPEKMWRSLNRKLRALEDDVILYPGHHYGARVSTMGEQKRTNPYLQFDLLDDFLAAMRSA